MRIFVETFPVSANSPTRLWHGVLLRRWPHKAAPMSMEFIVPAEKVDGIGDVGHSCVEWETAVPPQPQSNVTIS